MACDEAAAVLLGPEAIKVEAITIDTCMYIYVSLHDDDDKKKTKYGCKLGEEMDEI